MAELVVYLNQNIPPQIFPLKNGHNIIGSDSLCDVKLNLKNVEPQHCKIIVDSDGDHGLLRMGNKSKVYKLGHASNQQKEIHPNIVYEIQQNKEFFINDVKCKIQKSQKPAPAFLAPPPRAISKRKNNPKNKKKPYQKTQLVDDTYAQTLVLDEEQDNHEEAKNIEQTFINPDTTQLVPETIQEQEEPFQIPRGRPNLRKQKPIPQPKKINQNFLTTQMLAGPTLLVDEEIEKPKMNPAKNLSNNDLAGPTLLVGDTVIQEEEMDMETQLVEEHKNEDETQIMTTFAINNSTQQLEMEQEEKLQSQGSLKKNQKEDDDFFKKLDDPKNSKATDLDDIFYNSDSQEKKEEVKKGKQNRKDIKKKKVEEEKKEQKGKKIVPSKRKKLTKSAQKKIVKQNSDSEEENNNSPEKENDKSTESSQKNQRTRYRLPTKKEKLKKQNEIEEKNEKAESTKKKTFLKEKSDSEVEFKLQNEPDIKTFESSTKKRKLPNFGKQKETKKIQKKKISYSQKEEEKEIEIPSLYSQQPQKKGKTPNKLKISFKIMLTGITKTKEITNMISKLGGKYVDDINQDFNILLGEKLLRTAKILIAINKGIDILHFNWLKDSFSEGAFLEKKKYQLSDPENEEKFGLKLNKIFNKVRLEQQGIFSSHKFFISNNLKIPQKELIAIIESGNGEVVKKEIKDALCIMDEEKDKARISRYKKNKFKIYEVEFIFNAIIKREMDDSFEI